MNYAIIDIGSNTIRMNVYRFENQEIVTLFSKKETAGLLSYVSKKIMQPTGIKLLYETLQSFKKIVSHLKIDKISAFATASLRNIKNTEEVLEKVKENTGIEINILSGEQEGKLSFSGATYHTSHTNGLFIDLGGGSCEFVLFKNKETETVFSIPYGSLSLYNNYIENIIPTKEECHAIYNKFTSELRDFDPDKALSNNFLLGAGGTARAIAKMLADHDMIEKTTDSFDANNMSKLIKSLYEKDIAHTILKCKANRIHTFVPGLITIIAIIDYYDCKTMQISNYGIREGYFHDAIVLSNL